MNWLQALAIAADVLTVLAAGIAVWGVASVWWSRPRVDVTVMGVADFAVTVVVSNRKGTESVRDLLFAKGLLDRAGKAITWDGGGDWVPALGPRQTAVAQVSDASRTKREGEARVREFLHDVSLPHGFIMDVSWRHPLIPWLRSTRAIVWTQDERSKNHAPLILKNGSARRALKTAKANN